jgi:hypothetical protein
VAEYRQDISARLFGVKSAQFLPILGFRDNFTVDPDSVFVSSRRADVI